MKEVPLTQGKVAIVEDEDYERVMQHKWYAVKCGRVYYGRRSIRMPDGSWTLEYLHNFVLGIEGVDHIDGDGLDNRRQNTRPATKKQNQQAFRRKKVGATSQFRGVYWNKANQKWRVRIELDGKNFSLGQFAVESDAARAYDAKARELFGEFASPNFPT